MPAALKIKDAEAHAARQAYRQVPKRTKEDDPKGYSKTPNEYGDILIRGGKLGSALQRDIVYWIERRTWGDEKRPEYAALSLSTLAKLCQVWDERKGKLRPVEVKSVAVAIADLMRREIIAARDRQGCGKTTAKMYKLTPENWRAAKPYSPPTPKEIEAAEAETEEEDEEEAPTPTAATETAECTVEPGKFSRPQPVGIQVQGHAKPIRINVVYNPRGFDSAVTFRTKAGKNGRLEISPAPAASTHKHSEKKANDYGCAQPKSFANLSPSVVDNKRFTDFSSFTNTVTLKIWGKAADSSLVTRIVQAAGNAPVEVFGRIALGKLRSAAHAQKKEYVPGLLVRLAEDAAEAHAARQAIEAQEAAQMQAAAAEPYEAPPIEEETPFDRESAATRCAFCGGSGHCGHGTNRSACGICRGTGKAIRQELSAAARGMAR